MAEDETTTATEQTVRNDMTTGETTSADPASELHEVPGRVGSCSG